MASQSSAQTVELAVKGMTCGNCVSKVSHYLHTAGAEDIDVDLQHHRASFVIQSADALPPLIHLLEEKGFPSSIAKESSKNISLTLRVVIAALCTAPMLLHMLLPIPFVHHGWVQCLLSLPVILIGTLHFGQSALGALKRGIPNMDVLISMGAGSAFLYSLYGLLMDLGEDFYFFETAASIITFVLIGNLMEQKATHRTTSAIRELKSLQSVQARKVLPKIGGESIVVVDVHDVAIGDTLLINEGDRVPADGNILRGSVELDESLLTGESLPVSKEAKAQVYSGTIVTAGTAYIQASSIGSTTVLGEIIRLVKQAQEETPDIQRIGDKVSAYFVPAVSFLAILTFFASFLFLDVAAQESLLRAIAVLVIACPCAMGLATPTAVVVGVGLAAREGILVKGGATLEYLAQARHIFFDKTGTLTDGKFTIESFDVLDGIDHDSVVGIIRGLEQHSQHPLASSLLRELPEHPAFPFESVQETRGMGVQGSDAEGNTYAIIACRMGSIKKENADLVVECNHNPLAYISLRDKPRPSAQATLKALREKGIEVSMVSGDKDTTCQRLADELGITTVYSEQSPSEKLKILADMSKTNTSIFVGDGINDAPALAGATVGIALQGASHTAIQSARVVLLSNQLPDIIRALDVAEATLKTIKQNLFWAFFYNVLAIPFAAAGYLNPMLAAFTMAFSDVIVVGNSLYLKRRLKQQHRKEREI